MEGSDSYDDDANSVSLGYDSVSSLNSNAEEEDLTLPKPEGTQDPKSEDKQDPKQEDTQDPKSEDTGDHKPEDKRDPKSEDIQYPKQEDTQDPKSEDIQDPKQEDTQDPKSEDTQDPKQEDTQNPKSEDMQHPKQEDIQDPKQGDTQDSKSEDTEDHKPEDKRDHKVEDKQVSKEAARVLKEDSPAPKPEDKQDLDKQIPKEAAQALKDSPAPKPKDKQDLQPEDKQVPKEAAQVLKEDSPAPKPKDKQDLNKQVPKEAAQALKEDSPAPKPENAQIQPERSVQSSGEISPNEENSGQVCLPPDSISPTSPQDQHLPIDDQQRPFIEDPIEEKDPIIKDQPRSHICTHILIIICLAILPTHVLWEHDPISDTAFITKEWMSKQKYLDPNRKLNIMVAGKSGTGKSTLINGLFNKEIKEVGDLFDKDSSSITTKEFNIRKVQGEVMFWSSPSSSSSPKQFKLKHVDLVIYTIRMDETRIRPEDVESIRHFSRVCKSALWNRTLFVLTFANKVDYLVNGVVSRSKKHFDEKAHEWKMRIHTILREEGVPDSTVRNVPVIPAGHKTVPKLFESDEAWLSNVSKYFLIKLNENTRPAMLKIIEHNIEI